MAAHLVRKLGIHRGSRLGRVERLCSRPHRHWAPMTPSVERRGPPPLPTVDAQLPGRVELAGTQQAPHVGHDAVLVARVVFLQGTALAGWGVRVELGHEGAWVCIGCIGCVFCVCIMYVLVVYYGCIMYDNRKHNCRRHHNSWQCASRHMSHLQRAGRQLQRHRPARVFPATRRRWAQSGRRSPGLLFGRAALMPVARAMQPRAPPCTTRCRHGGMSIRCV